MKQTAMKYFGIVAIAMMLAPAESRAQQPLVVDTPFVHDPVMAYENGKYYLYCTGHGITQMTSTDRKHWIIVPQGVLKNSEIPAWKPIPIWRLCQGKSRTSTWRANTCW